MLYQCRNCQMISVGGLSCPECGYQSLSPVPTNPDGSGITGDVDLTSLQADLIKCTAQCTSMQAELNQLTGEVANNKADLDARLSVMYTVLDKVVSAFLDTMLADSCRERLKEAAETLLTAKR